MHAVVILAESILLQKEFVRLRNCDRLLITTT